MMQSDTSPLIDYSRGRWLSLFLFECAALLVAAACVLICVSVFTFGFSGWALGVNRWPPVLGLFLAWFFDRTKGSLVLFALVLLLTVVNIAKEDQNGFVRMVASLPLICIFGFGARQAFLHARASRKERRIVCGHPYTLYLRPSMADEGPFSSLEANLVRNLESIGATVMLSKRQIIRKSSVVRLDWRRWQDRVSVLMRHASLIVFFMMPRRGIDKEGVDLFWEEFEEPEVKELLPTGRIVLFFREGWTNKTLPLINKNGTVDLGDTSLITEVCRILRESVSVKWPQNFERTRFVWFSPGAKPQGLGEFNSSLGSRRRILAELSPVLDHFGVQPGLSWLRTTVAVAAFVTAFWIGNLPPLLDHEFVAHFKTQIAVISILMWVCLIVIGVRKLWHYYLWTAYDYDNFVLHDKYRFKNWSRDD